MIASDTVDQAWHLHLIYTRHIAEHVPQAATPRRRRAA